MLELRLLMTVTGTGDDGRDYTIHDYKAVDEALFSQARTSDGKEVWCRREKPLEFWIPSRSVIVRCPER
jgi:hypothetical protein